MRMVNSRLLRTAVCRQVCFLTAALLSGCGTGYRRDGNLMTFITWDEGRGKVTHPIQGADPGSFVVLKDGYAKDKWQIYFEGKTIWSAISNNQLFWAQPHSFEVLSHEYAKDTEFAYYRGEPFRADLSTFRVGLSGDWAADKNNVYVHAQAISACEPSSFVYLNYGWYRDGKCVYSIHLPLSLKRLPDADPYTFAPINIWFGADSKHVYTSDGDLLRGTNPASFIKIGKDAYLCKRGDEPSACYKK